MSGFLFFLLLTVLMSFLMNWVFMRYLHIYEVKETPTLPKTPKEHEQSSVEQMNHYMDGI